MTQPKHGQFKVGDLVRFKKTYTPMYEGIWEIIGIQPDKPTYVFMRRNGQTSYVVNSTGAYQNKLEIVFSI